MSLRSLLLMLGRTRGILDPEMDSQFYVVPRILCLDTSPKKIELNDCFWGFHPLQFIVLRSALSDC